jgi:uncharacterized protein YidB (DUF937 family)
MFEDIINLIEQHAGAFITNNPAIPNEQNAAVTGAASSSIIDGLKNAITSGNAGDVTSLLNGDHTVQNSPVAQNIQGNFVNTMMSKFGLSESAAAGTATSLIPALLEKMKSDEGGFDVSGLLSKFTGGANVDSQNPV